MGVCATPDGVASAPGVPVNAFLLDPDPSCSASEGGVSDAGPGVMCAASLIWSSSLRERDMAADDDPDDILASRLSRLRNRLSTSLFRGLPSDTKTRNILWAWAALKHRRIVRASHTRLCTVPAWHLLVCVVSTRSPTPHHTEPCVSCLDCQQCLLGDVHRSHARGTQLRGALPLDGACWAPSAACLLSAPIGVWMGVY